MKSERKVINKLLKAKKPPIKLNIGCGTDYKDGWINIDNNSDHNIEKLDLSWDLRNPLPFEDGSVDFVFNEHLFEHLTTEEASIVLKDILRVLRQGGVHRLAMPDLEDSVALYKDLNWRNNPLLKHFDFSFVKTRAEMLNIHFRWWGHKWLYDWEELERRLLESGCENIKRCQYRKSEHSVLRNLEIRQESQLIAEVVK